MEGTTLEFNKLKCKEHPLETLTNFCLNQNCKTGLCAQCICHHTDMHMQNGTSPVYKPLKEVHQFNQDKIRSYVKVLENDKDRIINVMKGIAERKSVFRGFLHEAKRDVLKMVDKVFQQMELKIEEDVKQEQKKNGLHSIFQIESLCKKINREIQVLINESQTLNSFKFIDVVKNIQSQTFGQVKRIHKDVVKQIKENQEFVPILEYRRENLTQLELSMRRLLSLSFRYTKSNIFKEDIPGKQNQIQQMAKSYMKIAPVAFSPTSSARSSIISEAPKHQRYASVSQRNSSSVLQIIPHYLDTNSFPFYNQKRVSGVSDFRLTGSKVFHVANRR